MKKGILVLGILVGFILFSIISISKEYSYKVKDSSNFHFGIVNYSKFPLKLDKSKSSGSVVSNAPSTIPANSKTPVTFTGGGTLYYYFNCPTTTKQCKKGKDYLQLTHKTKQNSAQGSFTAKQPSPTTNILIKNTDIDRCGFPNPGNADWGNYDCYGMFNNNGSMNLNN